MFANLQSILIASVVSFIAGGLLAWNISGDICDGKIAALQSHSKGMVIAAEQKLREEFNQQLLAKTVAEQKTIGALNDVKKTADNLRDRLDDAAIRLRICADSRKLPAKSSAASTAPASDAKTPAGQPESFAELLRDRFERCDQIIIEHNELVDTLCGYWPNDPRWSAACKY
jgi:hypothetical protein